MHHVVNTKRGTNLKTRCEDPNARACFSSINRMRFPDNIIIEPNAQNYQLWMVLQNTLLKHLKNAGFEENAKRKVYML
jgi:hypothetical protein